MIQLIKRLSLGALICVSLSGCYDSPQSTVSATIPESSYTAARGTQIQVPVTFTANAGMVSNLQVTNLSSLPAGWSVQNGANTFNCASVSAGGTSCQLNLIFAPTTTISNSTLNLSYSYISSNGTLSGGNIPISYSAVLPTYSYVSNGNPVDSPVEQCILNPADGTVLFSSCSAAGISNSLVYGPEQIAIQETVSGIPYMYVLNPNNSSSVSNTVAVCPVNSNGTINSSNCTNTNASQIDNPYGIAFQTIGNTTYAHIANYAGTITQCTVNPSNGSFNSCSAEGSFTHPVSIAFSTANNTTYAYITTQGASAEVTECPVNSDGTIDTGNCQPVTVTDANGQPVSFDQPDGITFRSLGNTTYVYIANTGDKNASPPVPGSVIQCTVNSGNGTPSSFSNCASTGSNFGLPVAINFQNAYGTTYAYVVNYANTIEYTRPGYITKCAINSLNGNLSQCISMENKDFFFSPTGIAFYAAVS